jgi:hypothetical protein
LDVDGMIRCCVWCRDLALCAVGWRTNPCDDAKDMEFYRVIRTARLRRLPDFHLRPINVVVFHDP